MMNVIRCSECRAELLPEANYCRWCGATVASASAEVITSEEPTRHLNERIEGGATQRLEPRATSPSPGSLKNPGGDSVAAANLHRQATSSRRQVPKVLLLGGVALVIVAIISSVAFVKMRSHSRITDNAALIYPGAQTVVDMTSDEGRAIQLQTGDSLDRVLAWYEGTLKPTKTMRLTSTSFVLKNQQVTATIATEDNKTNILIKQSVTP